MIVPKVDFVLIKKAFTFFGIEISNEVKKGINKYWP